MKNRFPIFLFYTLMLTGCSKSYSIINISSSVVNERPPSTIGPEDVYVDGEKWNKFNLFIKGRIVDALKEGVLTFRAQITNCSGGNVSVDEFYVGAVSMDSIRNGAEIPGEMRSDGVETSVYVSDDIMSGNKSLCIYGRGGSMSGDAIRTNEIRLK